MTADHNNTRCVGAGEEMTAFLELVHKQTENSLCPSQRPLLVQVQNEIKLKKTH